MCVQPSIAARGLAAASTQHPPSSSHRPSPQDPPAASPGSGPGPRNPPAASSGFGHGRRPAPRASIHGVLAHTIRHEGVRGIYRGIGPTLAGILPYAGLKFYVYQSLKQQYRGTEGHSAQRLPIAVMLGFGAGAGLVAQTATYPLDVVRRQMQVRALVPRLKGTKMESVLRMVASTPHEPLPQSMMWIQKHCMQFHHCARYLVCAAASMGACWAGGILV